MSAKRKERKFQPKEAAAHQEAGVSQGVFPRLPSKSIKKLSGSGSPRSFYSIS